MRYRYKGQNRKDVWRKRIDVLGKAGFVFQSGFLYPTSPYFGIFKAGNDYKMADRCDLATIRYPIRIVLCSLVRECLHIDCLCDLASPIVHPMHLEALIPHWAHSSVGIQPAHEFNSKSKFLGFWIFCLARQHNGPASLVRVNKRFCLYV